MFFTRSYDVLLSALDASGPAGGVEVDFDWTIVGQVALFLVLFVSLKPMLFDPMLKLFEAREQRIDGARKKAREIDAKSAGALATYDTAMTKARAEGNAERERIRSQGTAAQAERLATVRATIAKQADLERHKAQDELARVRATLRAELPGLGRQAASRVLGREVA